MCVVSSTPRGFYSYFLREKKEREKRRVVRCFCVGGEFSGFCSAAARRKQNIDRSIDRRTKKKREKKFVFVFRIFFLTRAPRRHLHKQTNKQTDFYTHTHTKIDYDDEASGEKTVLLDFIVGEKRFFFFLFFSSELLLE